MNKWYLLNSLALGYALGSFFTGAISLPSFFGLLGLLLVIFNWTRHAVFKTIRESSDRQQKIKFANLSKRILPFHKWTGTAALVFIMIHGALMLNKYGLFLANKKITSGLLAAIILICLVISGWLRWYRTTPAKRYVHWGLGFLIFFFVLIHLLF